MHAHARAHAHAHARTHARAHARTHARTHARMRTRTLVHTISQDSNLKLTTDMCMWFVAWKVKAQLLAKYKFVLAFENSMLSVLSLLCCFLLLLTLYLHTPSMMMNMIKWRLLIYFSYSFVCSLCILHFRMYWVALHFWASTWIFTLCLHINIADWLSHVHIKLCHFSLNCASWS